MTKNQSVERPPNHHIRAMQAASFAYMTNAQCWLSSEAWQRVCAQFEVPDHSWGTTPAEDTVAEQMWFGFWAANAL